MNVYPSFTQEDAEAFHYHSGIHLLIWLLIANNSWFKILNLLQSTWQVR